ncbi:MAG: efflux RND transporter permease subunit [Phycisphaerae bacterium]|nr:efflux RND transporter permease subunit [Gemmatimonadaceae bacterium]
MNWIGDIARFSVRRYQFTVLMFLMLAALGVSSWFAIPRAEDPDFPVPIYTTFAVYPGASPEDMEQLIVEPIEKKLNTLDDIKSLESKSMDGVAVINIEFESTVDADRKFDEVQREINAIRPELPAQIRSLEVRHTSNSDLAVLQLALVSPLTPFHALNELAERIEGEVEAVPGVKEVKRWAAPEREMHVTVDLGRLSVLNIPPAQLFNAIGSDNTQIPGGSVNAGTRRFNVATSSQYRTERDVEQTVIGSANGASVRVGDVATVAWADAEPVHVGRYNGQRAMFVTVAVQAGRNISKVRDEVWSELDRIERTLPAGVKLARGFDQSQNVDARLGRLGADFGIALLLVLVTLLPLGWRASIVVMISIPLSLAIAVVMLNATGYSINQLSIVGFVIALGLLVDDSIVVVENITRFLREGVPRAQAAILATQQIGKAVLGATATLIFAFLPLIFLPGLSGNYIRSLPMAVVFSVLASLLVSITIVPWLASLILPANEAPHGNRFLRLLDRAIHLTYAPILHRALAAPKLTLAVAGSLVVLSFALVPTVGFSLFPKAGTPQFHVEIETPDGSSLAETDRATRFTERVIAAHPQVKGIFANVGKDNPSVYYNVFQRAEAVNRAQLLVLLTSYDNEETPVMLDSLRMQLASYPGARIELKEFENGPPVDAPIALRLEGPAVDTLQQLAAQVERALRETSGTQYVNNPVRLQRTELRVQVDRAKAGLLGVANAEVERTLRVGLAGLEIAKIRDAGGDEHPLVVRMAHEGLPTPDALERIHVASYSGALVPLSQVSRTGFAATPTIIDHRDRQRAVTVTSFVRSGFNTDAVTNAVLRRLDSLKLPVGYKLVAAGEIESRQESFGGIGGAIIVAVFVILAILVLEFRNFRTTLVVASVIPLGLVGGILALLATGYTLSFTAMIGFVALIGIEIKTSILLVDFTDQLRAEGLSLDDAVEKAGAIRFVPIVLTTFTAIGGLLPLAFQGSGLYSPLAWVIIGGLVSSTLIARLVTPVLYKMLAPAHVYEPDEQHEFTRGAAVLQPV